MALLYVAAAAPVLLLILNGAFPEPVLPAAWVIAQGVGFVWIGSGAWGGRERWAVRLQVTFIAAAVAALMAAQQSVNVSGVGLMIFLVAVVFLHAAHLTSLALRKLQAGAVTVRGFASTEAARQGLFFATFAMPAALAVAPNVIGFAAAFIATVTVVNFVARRASRVLRAGLSREVLDV